MAIRTSKKGTGINYKGTQKEILKILDREVDSYVHRMATAFKKSVQQICRQAVVEWYVTNNLSTGEDVAKSISTSYAFKRRSNVYTDIEVSIDADMSILDQTSSGFPSAQRWIDRHDEINVPWNPGTYMFYLRWATGALALPERAHFTGSGWTNPNYLYSTIGPMESYVKGALQDQALDLIFQLMRSRNTRMGAGINSKGRDSGLKNLDKHRRR